MKRFFYVLFLLTALFAVSCEWDDVDETNAKNNAAKDDNGDNITTVPSTKLPSMKVAVVLPLDNSYRPRFERIASWAQQNIVAGTRNVPFKIALEDLSGIDIEIEWFDENTIDVDAVSDELASRKDISAILGPMYSSDAQVFALACARTGMNILLPCTTSSEVVRKFSSKPWFWSFAETDIRQCQVILESAQQLNATSVSLIASNSFYGQTFINWLPFELYERGMKLNKIYAFDGDLSKATAELAMDESVENQVIICAPGEVSDVLTIQNAVKSKNPKGKVIFSDIAMDPSLLSYGGLFDDAMGIGITADGESGFLAEYAARYSQEPTEGECQFYDALVLMSLVAADLYNQGFSDAKTENAKSVPGAYNSRVSDALTRILKPGDINELFLTKPEDIKSLVMTRLYNLRGASGHINFDKGNRASVAHSTYQLWTINNREFKTMKFFNEAEMSTDAWESEVSKVVEIPTSGVNITYPALHSKWALLVAGSNLWSDYRHQANVLKVYNMLKANGYPDDHIVMIMENNLVNNPSNPNQGQMLSSNGTDLYKNAVVDYKLSSLTVSDLAKILKGESSDKLGQVIGADSDDNILVYWTGNGVDGELEFGNSAFTADDFSDLVEQMAGSSKKFRKMLWITDASFAQSVASISDSKNIPGVLCINSSTALETSLADQCDFNETMETYLSTHFTNVLVDEFTKSGNDTYYHLYESLAKYTSGSHVNLSNVSHFDNLKTSTIAEFVHF